MNKEKLIIELKKYLDDDKINKILDNDILLDEDKKENSLDKTLAMQCVAEYSPNIIIRSKFDEKMEIVFVSNEMTKTTGYTREEISKNFNNSLLNLIYYEDRKNVLKFLKNCYIGGSFTLEYRLLRKNDEPLWMMASIRVSQEEDELYICSFLVDISHMKKTQDELKLSQEQFRNAIESDDNIIFEFEIETNYIYFSKKSLPKSLESLGYANELYDFLERGLIEKNSINVVLTTIEAIKNGQNTAKCQILCRENEFGPAIWLEVSLSTVFVEDKAVKAIGFARNITNIKNEALKFKQLAELDPLTGILNKISIQNTIKRELKTVKQASLVMLDVDNFKEINDVFGHSEGDSLIKSIANCLIQIKDENTIVGRMGGDEFIIFTKDISEEQLMQKLDVIKGALVCYKVSTGKKNEIKISGGISKYPNNGDTFEKLYHKADMALYYTKRIGGNDFCIYEDSIGRSYKTFIKRLEDKKLADFTVEKSQKRGILRNWKSFFTTCILLFLVVSIIMFGTLTFYKEELKKEAMLSLKETAIQVSANLKKEFDNDLQAMFLTTKSLQNLKLNSESDITSTLNKVAEENGFSKIAVIIQDDINADVIRSSFTVINSLNEKFAVLEKDLEETRNIITSDKSLVSNLFIKNDKEYLGYFIPTNIDLAGKKVRLIMGTITTEIIQDRLNIDLYSGAGFSHIINENGKSVILSNNANALSSHFDLFNMSEKENIRFTNDKYDIDLKMALSKGQSCFVDYKKSKINKVGVITALGINNWSLLTIVDEGEIFYFSKSLYYITVFLIVGVFAVSTILFATYVVFDNKNKKTLRKLAYYDILTNAPKINILLKHIEEINDKEKTKYAMVYTNIINFKIINDRYGANMGDMVLVSISQTIKSHLNYGEFYSRLNSDHFGILLQINSLGNLEERLNEIAEEISNKHFGNNLINAKITFGVYSIGIGDKNAQSIVDNAIIALKKSNKKSTINYYSKEIKQKMIMEKRLEDRMTEALKNGQFEVYFQPKINIFTNKCEGAEALIRWNDPDLGIIFPNDFIPLFEKNGFITEIDLFVFEKVCQTLNSWKIENKQLIPISFNFSKANLYIENYLQPFLDILEKYDTPTNLIEFEFTETMAIENINELINLIELLHEKGIKCALDDFGSGFSSLSVLKDINVDVIKIDKDFFNSNLGNENRYENVVKGVIKIAKDLKIETVAEGIEEIRQVNFLKTVGCNLVQGYYFSKPIIIEEFIKKYID